MRNIIQIRQGGKKLCPGQDVYRQGDSYIHPHTVCRRYKMECYFQVKELYDIKYMYIYKEIHVQYGFFYFHNANDFVEIQIIVQL